MMSLLLGLVRKNRQLLLDSNSQRATQRNGQPEAPTTSTNHYTKPTTQQTSCLLTTATRVAIYFLPDWYQLSCVESVNNLTLVTPQLACTAPSPSTSPLSGGPIYKLNDFEKWSNELTLMQQYSLLVLQKSIFSYHCDGVLSTGSRDNKYTCISCQLHLEQRQEIDAELLLMLPIGARVTRETSSIFPVIATIVYPGL
jgi:hypothetical protein